MNKTKFKAVAKKAGVNVYVVQAIREKRHKGFRISYSWQIDDNTTTAEQTQDFWGYDLTEIIENRLIF